MVTVLFVRNSEVYNHVVVDYRILSVDYERNDRTDQKQ